MDGAGDQFLARSGLAGDERRLGMAGDAIDQAHEVFHNRTGEDELRSIDSAEDGARRALAVRYGSCGHGDIRVPVRDRKDQRDKAHRWSARIAKNCRRELDGKTATGLRVREKPGLIVTLGRG